MSGRLRIAILAILAVLSPLEICLAGPNADGTLILHANTTLLYSAGSLGYCDQVGLTSCAEAVSTVDADPEVTTIFFVVAAFPGGASPRLKGVTFGVSYEPQELAILEADHCADFALPTEDWPDPGSGTALTWESAQTDLLVELAWFAGYAAVEETPTTFELIEHPTQGASFADDAVPAVLDAVADFGSLGFGKSGDAPCPQGQESMMISSGAIESSFSTPLGGTRGFATLDDTRGVAPLQGPETAFLTWVKGDSVSHVEDLRTPRSIYLELRNCPSFVDLRFKLSYSFAAGSSIEVGKPDRPLNDEPRFEARTVDRWYGEHLSGIVRMSRESTVVSIDLYPVEPIADAQLYLSFVELLLPDGRTIRPFAHSPAGVGRGSASLSPFVLNASVQTTDVDGEGEPWLFITGLGFRDTKLSLRDQSGTRQPLTRCRVLDEGHIACPISQTEERHDVLLDNADGTRTYIPLPATPSRSSARRGGASIWTVGPGEDCATIQDCIDGASSGDAIHIMPGTYVENIIVDKDLSIHAFFGDVIIQPSNSSEPVVTYVSGIDGSLGGGITIQGGSAFAGSAILIGGNCAPHFVDVEVSGAASIGGCIAAAPSECLFVTVTADDCTSVFGGGGAQLQGVSNSLGNALFDCSFSNCNGGLGGGVQTVGGASITDCRFTNCTADDSGGAMYLRESVSGSIASVTISATTIDDCTADEVAGGGIFGWFVEADIAGCTIQHCTGPRGGGIYLTEATAHITDCTIEDNAASSTEATGKGYGGGINLNFGEYYVANCQVSQNEADCCGGGVRTRQSTVQIYECDIVGNSALGSVGGADTGRGGGVLDHSGVNVEISGGRISNNDAANDGGGLFATGSSSFRVAWTDITVNLAPGDDGAAGFFNGIGDLSLENLTLRGNQGFSTMSFVSSTGNFVRNVVAENTQSGSTVFQCASSSVAAECNVWWDNGDVPGSTCGISIGVDDNVQEDPLFCSSTLTNVSVSNSSPATPGQSPCSEMLGSGIIGCATSDVPEAAVPLASALQLTGLRNPWSGSLAFNLSPEVDSVELFGVTGRRVAQIDGRAGSGVDLALSPGVYWIRVSTINKATLVDRLVVSR